MGDDDGVDTSADAEADVDTSAPSTTDDGSDGGSGLVECEFANNQVCEEPGACAAGTDWADCEYCPALYLENDVCDFSICPPDTDLTDCGCPAEWFGDGLCDQESRLDACDRYSDVADCGCPPDWANDGTCDERGLDACLPGSDSFDCGYCPDELIMDEQCNETGPLPQCPEGTDVVDCTCATTANGICDEPEGTATCPEGSDPRDCA